MKQFLKEYEGAIADYSKATETVPDFGYTYANRAMVEIKLNRKDDACKDFHKAVELGVQETEEEIEKYCQ